MEIFSLQEWMTANPVIGSIAAALGPSGNLPPRPLGVWARICLPCWFDKKQV